MFERLIRKIFLKALRSLRTRTIKLSEMTEENSSHQSRYNAACSIKGEIDKLIFKTFPDSLDLRFQYHIIVMKSDVTSTQAMLTHIENIRVEWSGYTTNKKSIELDLLEKEYPIIYPEGY